MIVNSWVALPQDIAFIFSINVRFLLHCLATFLVSDVRASPIGIVSLVFVSAFEVLSEVRSDA